MIQVVYIRVELGHALIPITGTALWDIASMSLSYIFVCGVV